MGSYGSGPGDWNCTVYPPLQPNPDIGGIGMLISFVASAYITFLCCIAKARIDHFRSPEKNTPKLDVWSYALGSVIMSFSDQQLVTGISVLVGGFSQLYRGLDSYHWQTVANLAWFSAFTHIATLTVLRKEDRSNKKIRVLRIIAMGILVAMLVSCLYSVGWVNGGITGNNITISHNYTKSAMPFDFPALCLYRPDLVWGYIVRPENGTTIDSGVMGVTFNWMYTALAWTIIILAYLTRVLLQYYDTIPQGIYEILCFKKVIQRTYGLSGTGMQSIRDWLNRIKKTSLGSRLCRSIYFMAYSANSAFTSILWEFIWMFYILVWGTLRIFLVRSDVSTNQDIRIGTELGANYYSRLLLEEDTWAFGQVVSLVLLILPFASFFDAYTSPLEPNVLKMKANSESGGLPNTLCDQGSATRPIYLPLPNNSINSPAPSIIQQELRQGVWFNMVVICWYALSFTFEIFAIDVFFGAATVSSFFTEDFGMLWRLCSKLLLYEVAWLWLLTLIFTDEDLQRVWKRTEIGKLLSTKPFSNIVFITAAVVNIGVRLFCLSIVVLGHP